MNKAVQNLLSFLALVVISALCVITLVYMLGFQLFFSLAIIFTPFVFKKQWYKWIYILYKTFPRDCIALSRFARLTLDLYSWERKNKTLVDLFKDRVEKHPNKICFYYEDSKWTFREVEEYSNKIARYFKSQGYKKGDTVALLMENRPEYCCLWLGLSKVGVVGALINNNLVKQPLIHSITIAQSKAIIFGSDYIGQIKDIRDSLGSDMKYYQFNTNSNVEILENSINLLNDIKPFNEDYLGEELVRTTNREKLLYIFTSGTTGLPKAAVITQLRFFMMAAAVKNMINLYDDDIIYDPLPMYHSSGTCIGVGEALIYGLTVAIRKKFSATNYWKDCIKYNCTVGQYIGELCRYLLAVPPGDPSEKMHSIRKMYGNGLKSQIWNRFVERFQIKEIGELYGATEGNSNLANFEGVPGAVGFKPVFIRDAYPVYLIRCNQATGEPIRNNEGLCILCKVNEPGIFVGKINKKKPVSDFAGYTDRQATKKKILENVFKKGDCFFNSGDVLIKDELGYFYFKDRIGDTFRWKGENVATTEIEAVISDVIQMKDATVYGVEVPHTDGRCGMAAIVDMNNTLNLKQLAEGLRKNLPTYAYPFFLRILKDMPLTGTFKLRKVDLQEEGYDIHRIKDALYFYDTKIREFVPLTENLYNDIIEGKVRL